MPDPKWYRRGHTPMVTKMWDHGYADILAIAAHGRTITPCEGVAASYDNGDYLHGDNIHVPAKTKKYKKFKKTYWTKVWLKNGWGIPPDHLFED